MSSILEPKIWSHDTGQQILCFDKCQLTITGMFNIKEVRYKTRPHVSVNLLAGIIIATILHNSTIIVIHEAGRDESAVR